MSDIIAEIVGRCRTFYGWSNGTLRASLIQGDRKITKGAITLCSIPDENPEKHNLSFMITPDRFPATFNLIPQLVKALESDSKLG